MERVNARKSNTTNIVQCSSVKMTFTLFNNSNDFYCLPCEKAHDKRKSSRENPKHES